MTEIRFYHLERQTLEQALPALLSKACENGHRIIVKTKSEQEIQRLSEHLWTYNPNSFLPHGSAKDGFAERQPIWLTTGDDNPNNADVLILINGAETETLEGFTLCCKVFDGLDESAVKGARANWKTYQDNGFEMTYWQQGEKGWEKRG